MQISFGWPPSPPVFPSTLSALDADGAETVRIANIALEDLTHVVNRGVAEFFRDFFDLVTDLVQFIYHSLEVLGLLAKDSVGIPYRLL